MFLSLLLAAAASQGEVLDHQVWDPSTVTSLGVADGDQFGQSVAVLGDLDGDGRDEIAVGAPYAVGGGAVKVLFLAPNGSVASVQTVAANTGGFAGSLDDGDLFGWALAPLGDLNGDGTPDLAVGARRDDDGGENRGAVWVLFLEPDGSVGSQAKISSTAGSFGGFLLDGDQFGFALAAPGDLDGDGITELGVSVQMQQSVSTLWPGVSPTAISAGLPGSFESSGAAWNPVREELILVSDTGQVARMDLDGGNVSVWSPGGDLEGVAIADPSSDLIYVGIESPDSIAEFDLSTGTLTGNVWFLTPWMMGIATRGLEGLTFGDGRFYAAHQDEGATYVFELGPAGAVQFIETLASPLGLGDLSALHFEPSTQTLYAMHGSDDTLVEMTTSGELLRSYDVPGANQEGFTLVADCPSSTARAVVARDGGSVERYANYPVNCYGPESLPGIGAVWMLFLNADGSVQDQERIGFFAGGFSGVLGPGDRFGASLAAVGDLNGDGVPDLAAGAPQDDDGGLDRGAVWFLNLGADGRVVGNPKISATQGGGVTLSNNDQFGWSVASLGDLNGDGITDLAVGSPGTDVGGSSRGATRILFLQSNGSFATDASIDDTTPGFAGALGGSLQFGTAVAGPVDLDGNGVGDLLVGAAGAEEGEVFALELDGVPTAAVLRYGCDTGVTGSLSVLAGSPASGGSITLGIDNPFGSQPAGSFSVLALSLSPAAGFPCGISVPNFGMSAPGSAGELLIDISAPNPIQLILGPTWMGTGQPAPVSLGVPSGAALLGLSIFAQGALFDPTLSLGIETGLTDALQLRIGS